MPVNMMPTFQSEPQKKGKLDTVAQAVDIASKVLGTGIDVYNAPLERRLKQGQEEQTSKENKLFPLRKEKLELGSAADRASIGQDTEPAKAGDAGAFDVPGMGLRKPVTSLKRTLEELAFGEKSRDLEVPDDAEYGELLRRMPFTPLDVLKKTYPNRGKLSDALNRTLGATTISLERPNRVSVGAFAKDFVKTAPGDPTGTAITLDTGETVHGKPKKELSQATIDNLAEGKLIPSQLDKIEQLIAANTELFGPIEGNIRAVNPYDPRAQTVNAQMKASSQAFGRYMEGGVLRKEDEVKYLKMFPQLGDTVAVAHGKLGVVRTLLVDKQEQRVSSFKAQGFDMAGFEAAKLKGDIDNDGQISEAEQWVMDNPDHALLQETIRAIKERKKFAK